MSIATLRLDGMKWPDSPRVFASSREHFLCAMHGRQPKDGAMLAYWGDYQGPY